MSKFSHENFKSKKGHNFVKKKWRITSPTGLGSPFDYSEFQVNIFSNNRDIRKYQRFHMKILSRKRGITLSKKLEDYLSYWYGFPLLIVNNYSEFQVNIFSNNRDIRKCQSFCTTLPPLPTRTTPGL